MSETIERLYTNDMAAVAELEAACFSSPWTEKQLQDAVCLPHFIVYGLKRQGRLLAYVSLGLAPGELEVLNLATRQDCRRQGLGKKLLEAALEAAKNESKEPVEQIVLEVREGNAPARGLYATLGFTKVGLRKCYYQDNGENALIMAR